MVVLLLNILASLLIVATCLVYLWQVHKGESIPNPATWFVTVILTTMNGVSYLFIVKDFSKAVVALVVPLIIIVIFIFSLLKGKFSRLSSFDGLLLALTGVLALVWARTGDNRTANFVMQLVLLSSFIPIVIGLLKGTNKEKITSWLLAVSAYVLNILAIVIDFNGDYLALVYPIVNGIIGNGMVALVILFQGKFG